MHLLTFIKYILAGTLLVHAHKPIYATQDELSFRLRVPPQEREVRSLLQNPTYLLLALQNILPKGYGFGRVEIIDGRQFFFHRGPNSRFPTGSIEFKGSSGEAYRYNAKVTINLAGVRKEVTTDFTIDSSHLSQGEVELSAPLGVFSMIPGLKDRTHNLIRERLNQSVLMELADSMRSWSNQSQAQIFNSILATSYNRAGTNTNTSTHAATSASGNQNILLAVFLFWFVLFPIAFTSVKAIKAVRNRNYSIQLNKQTGQDATA